MAYKKSNPNGSATMANSEPVVIASDQTVIPVSDNGGSLTIDNGALTSIDSKITAVNTGAVVVSSSALPTGAATAAKQPALGSAGTASSDVITVQGIASMTALKTDGSAVTQPVSGTVTAAQSTATNLKTQAENYQGGSAVGSGNPLQVTLANTGANSTAVKVDNSAVTQPISAVSLPLPSTAATSTKQSDGSQKTQIVDGSGNVIGSTSNALDVNIKSGSPTSAISTNNSSTSTLGPGATFTGTGEDVTAYSELRVSVISNVASATDGLSIQQSPDNTNWDITDTYTISAATGKTIVIPRQARYFRVVYTNGGTAQGSFRLQSILNRQGTAPSSQRPSDGYTNETDLVQGQSFLMGYNGSTWDRLRTDTTNGLDVDVTRVIPGTGATALGKAEDAGHTTGDTGVFVLGVRNDTLADVTSATADYSQLSTDVKGRVITSGAPRGLKTTQQTTITSSTTETTVLTAVASTFLDVYGVIVANTSASACDVTFKDSTAGTTRFNIYVPAGDTRGFMLPIDAAHPQATVNNNWTATCGTSVASIKITMFAVKMV